VIFGLGRRVCSHVALIGRRSILNTLQQFSFQILPFLHQLFDAF
jgi:hypothetical protein